MTIDAQTAFNNAVEKQYDVVIKEIDHAISKASKDGKFEVYFDEYTTDTFIKVERIDPNGNVQWSKTLSRHEYKQHVKDQQGLLLDGDEENSERIEKKSYVATLLESYHDLNTLLKYYDKKGFSFENFYGNHTDYSNDKNPRHALIISWK